MTQIFDENGKQINLNKLDLLSNKGSEFIVYKYEKDVVKLYKENYKLSHLSPEEMKFLSKLSTKRILVPSNKLLDQKGNMIGYQMPLILGERDLQMDSMQHLLQELCVLKNDIDLLCEYSVILMDINPGNTIYNGNLFLIDPGNYLINELDKVIFHVDVSKLSIEEKKKLLIGRNYQKINELIEVLLFINNDNFDFYQKRQIVQFFIKEREANNVIYNLDILKQYFDSNLRITDSIKKFVNEYIKDDPNEKALFLSLFKK